jgi:hypothetical protein
MEPLSPAPWPSPMQLAQPTWVEPMMKAGVGIMPPALQSSPCAAEFLRLRSDFEKAGALAKAANGQHVPFEDFCKAVTSLSVASNRWTRFTRGKAAACGIPGEAVAQLKRQDDHLADLKKKVCDPRLRPKPRPMQIANWDRGNP